ncbi:MAG TPA: thioredoxin domain-containing protein, partial [Polyangiaceae bacterium]|nr:thioredoxin domain-containing protein [Polyangiaceae bacterium]
MPLPTVSERNFEQEVLLSEEPVLVEFGAEWCGPCKTMLPELMALAEELKGKAKVVTVDIDRSPMIARQLGV